MRMGVAASTEQAIESRIGQYPNAPKLTEEEKHKVCEWYATFHTSTEIVRKLKAECGKEIKRKSIDDTIHGTKWKPLIDRLRQEWAAGVMDLPLAHKRGRMEELARLYRKAEANPKISDFSRVNQCLNILHELREEMDEKRTNFTTIFATSITNYSDEELLRRREEVLTRLKELRAPALTVVEVNGGANGTETRP